MANELFEKFIDSLTTEPADAGWAALKAEWLNYVEKFYEIIFPYLKPYIDANKLTLTFGEKVVTEDYIGQYSVKTATIKIGISSVYLHPIGTNLIGTRGRIDMIGPSGTMRFLLVDKEAKQPRVFRGDARRIKDDTEITWTWKIATYPPNIEYIDLDENTFLEALMAVVNA